MSELQTAITNLQLKHSELVAAVKSYPGTVASAANAAVGEASVEQRKVRDTVQSLRNQIENDGQSLILDWEHDVAVVNGVGKPINEVVEFSRSTGGGRFGPDGKYEWVEAGVPRIDYDPETGECLGLLVEEQRTNLATGVHSGFSLGNVTGVTFESAPPFLSDPGVTPDAVRVSTTGETSTRFQNRVESQAVGELLTVSWYERYVNYTPVVGTSALSLGQLEGLEIQTPIAIQEVKPGIFRATATLVTTLVGSVIFRAYFSKFGNVLNAVEFWAFQVEEGPFPTSYIPTQGTAVTRARDVVTVNDISPWYNQDEGSLLVRFLRASLSRSVNIARLSGTGADNYAQVESAVARPEHLRLHVREQGASVYATATNTSEANVFGTIAARYGQGRVTAAYDGRVGADHLLPTDANYSALSIASRLNGAIKRLEYYPRAVSDTELQELTQ